MKQMILIRRNESGMVLLIVALIIFSLALIGSSFMGSSINLTWKSSSSLLSQSANRNLASNAASSWAMQIQTALNSGDPTQLTPFHCAAIGATAAGVLSADKATTYTCQEIKSGSVNPKKRAFLITAVQVANNNSKSEVVLKYIPQTCSSSSVSNPAAYGSGTQADPYVICTAAQLSGIQNKYSTAYFALNNDIDLSGTSFQAIQSVMGFDGKNFKVKNLNASASFIHGIGGGGLLQNLTLENPTILRSTFVSSDEDFGGVVGSNSGTIQNVHITSTGPGLGSVSCNNCYVGGIVGHNYDSGVVINSDSSVAVSSTGGGWAVGGLVGENTGVITHSFATGSVSGACYVGGLVGFNWINTHAGVVQSSYATGNVSATDGCQAGGFVGMLGNMTTITNSFATGAVYSSKGPSGSFVGQCSGAGGASPPMSNVYGTGAVTGTLSYMEGGLSFSCSGTGSYWNTATTGQATSAFGTGKTTAQMQQIATYAGWDTSVWLIQNGSYPTLK